MDDNRPRSRGEVQCLRFVVEGECGEENGETGIRKDQTVSIELSERRSHSFRTSMTCFGRLRIKTPESNWSVALPLTGVLKWPETSWRVLCKRISVLCEGNEAGRTLTDDKV